MANEDILARRAARIRELQERERQATLQAENEEDEVVNLDDEEEPEEIIEPEPPPPPRAARKPRVSIDEDRRARLLQHLNPSAAALISDEELAAIEARMAAKAAAERKKDVLERLEEDLLHRARVEQGLLSEATLRTASERARLAQKVRVKIELPGGGAGRHANGFRIDGRLYQVGREYEITRAEFESMQETHYRIHVNEIRFSTLDQDQKAGITLNNRAIGTTAANVLFAQAPVRLEVRDVE